MRPLPRLLTVKEQPMTTPNQAHLQARYGAQAPALPSLANLPELPALQALLGHRTVRSFTDAPLPEQLLVPSLFRRLQILS